MEVAGLVLACAGALAGLLKVIEQATEAWTRQKNGVLYLEDVRIDANAIIRIVELIKREHELHKDHVAVALSLVEKKAQQLATTIHDLAAQFRGDSSIRRLVSHYFDLQAEKDSINKLCGELNHAKSTLILSMQMAQVGLIQSAGQRNYTVKIEVVYRVNELFNQCPELEQGLRIVQLLRDRGLKIDDDKWQLRAEDLGELAKPPPYNEASTFGVRPMTERIIERNQVTGRSIAFIEVGKDGGDGNSIFHPDRMVVQDNLVSGGSLFIGNTSVNNAGRLMEVFQKWSVPRDPSTDKQ